MKGLIRVLAVVCGMFLYGASAWALTINSGTTEVGVRDQFVNSTILGNSSDAEELGWVQSILGADYTLDKKFEFPDETQADYWKLTDDTIDNTYAMALFSTAPEYFLIKTAVSKDKPDHFLFKNLDDLAWAVVNLDLDFGGYEIKNIGKFSHVDEFSGGSTPVPEPGTMVLLGAGLLGLAIFGKRRQNKA